MTLREARCAFSVQIAYLVLFAVSKGYDIALDEGTDHITVKDPTTDHMKGSLHEIGLAQDVLLYRQGEYLDKTEQYEILGAYWEDKGKSLGIPLRWGGRFRSADGNHFAWSWGGRS
jgi:hypothetical protein